MMKNYEVFLDGKFRHCTSVSENVGREVPVERRDAVASDHEGPDINLKDVVAYIDHDGRRRLVDWRDGYDTSSDGLVYKITRPTTIFVDEQEAFYKSVLIDGKETLVGDDAIPGKYHLTTGEVVEISGCPVFRTVNEAGQYTGHILSTIAVKKLRRKTEEKLRTGDYSLTMRTAAACGVSLV
jgi:hypothetical protein